MAVAEHADNIELRDIDDTIYDDIDARPAARERDPLQEEEDEVYYDVDAEDGHYEQLEVQQIDDATYEDVAKTRKEKDLQKIVKSDRRQYKRALVGAGLLCAVLVLFNVAVPLYLHQSNMVRRDQWNNNLTEERYQFQTRFDQLMTRYNLLTEEKEQIQTSFDQLQNRHSQLTEQKDNLQTSFDLLKKTCDKLTCQGQCEYGWWKLGCSCYYFSTGKNNWEDSRQWCRAKQSDLIVINSRDELGFVALFNKAVWLGLTDRVIEGSFQWVDGTPLTTPTYWMPGEPQFNTLMHPNALENCVEYYDGWSRPEKDRGWNDIECSHSNYWICERVL